MRVGPNRGGRVAAYRVCRPGVGRRALTFARDTLPSAAAAGRGVFVGRAGELAVLAAAAAAASWPRRSGWRILMIRYRPLRRRWRRGSWPRSLARAEKGIGFTHLLVQRCRVRRSGPGAAAAVAPAGGGPGATGTGRWGTWWRRRWARIMSLQAGWETAARESRRHGRAAQAAAWLAQAAALSGQPEAADRLLLDALEILVTYGEMAEAETLAARVAAAGPSTRRSWLLGALDFLSGGRTAAAEARLREAWQAHDPVREAAADAAAAFQLEVLCVVAGRIPEAIEWGERAAADGAAVAARHQALGVLAIALLAAGRGPEGLARLAFLPANPSEVPREDTDVLMLRGKARVWAEDLAGAVADLSTAAARLRAGVPLRSPSLCLTYLAGAEARLGSWDDAVVHAELAVRSPRTPTGCGSSASCTASPLWLPRCAVTGEAASAHVRMADEAARTTGDTWTIGAAASARAFLAMARGDLEGVIDAAAAVRTTGRAEFLSFLVGYDWVILEIEALVGLDRLGQAETALAELETALSRAGPVSARVAAARLRGDLATAAGHQDAAAAAFATAWRRAQGLRVPLALAQLEISDARRLRAAGQSRQAVARLRSARQRLITLGARLTWRYATGSWPPPGAPVEPETAPAFVGLAPAEQAVARLVGTGRTNRQTAAELYISVKTVESHLGHIFDKLSIRSGLNFAEVMGRSRWQVPQCAPMCPNVPRMDPPRHLS